MCVGSTLRTPTLALTQYIMYSVRPNPFKLARISGAVLFAPLTRTRCSAAPHLWPVKSVSHAYKEPQWIYI